MQFGIFSTLFVVLIFLSNPLAQSVDSSQVVSKDELNCCINSDVVGLTYITGYMIPHAKEVLNVRGTNPRGLELAYYSHLNTDEVWLDCECYPRVGAFISFYDFDITDILGYGFSGGINFTYFFGLPSDFNFHLKGKAGLAYLTKPFDKEKHPQNMSYSTHFNYILSAGAGITIRLYKNFELQLEGSMNHQSNAALLEPNGGINYWAASSSLNYILQPVDFKPRKIDYDSYLYEPKKTRWDLSFSWGISSMPYPEPGQVPMYGLTVNRSIQVYRILALLFGAEIERNGRAVELFRRYRPGEYVNPYRFSLLGGVEFLMGRTLFSVQFGGYLFIPFRHFVADGFPPRTFEDRTYQRWGLVYNIFENIYAGINFKSYRSSADHLSLRLTFSF
ncbi:MAG: acyloxyacyl hydrolase [Ignavibacterium sp.]|uniref:acyloxyacyl hydrolase n=1 Tax=Ignavibacterium sp. TaxID=2651167 RepID=UPI00404B4638